jgi:hypothetical protein
LIEIKIKWFKKEKYTMLFIGTMGFLKILNVNLFIVVLSRIVLFNVVRLLSYFLLFSISFDFVCCSCFWQYITRLQGITMWRKTLHTSVDSIPLMTQE